MKSVGLVVDLEVLGVPNAPCRPRRANEKYLYSKNPRSPGGTLHAVLSSPTEFHHNLTASPASNAYRALSPVAALVLRSR